MEITRELILRFFKNQCTAEEATEVANYLALHEELLEEFLPEQSWNETNEQSSELQEDKKAALLQKIRLRLGISHTRTKSIWWMSAAASILIVGGLLFWQNKKPAAIQHPANELVHNLVKMNYGKEEMRLEIIDGSTVILEPGSELRYPEYFKGKDRNFYLKGVARFKVAKDRSRPFKVHAGETVTTALGTDFTVTNRAADQQVIIALHEGRVVVGPENLPDQSKMKVVYLKPGQQLAVNKANLTTELSSMVKASSKMENPVGLTEISASTISFKNQRLDSIFSTLDKEFATKIYFKAHEVSKLYFTGTFERDSLTAEKILKEIALLNHLKIDKKGDTYHLRNP